MVKNRKIFIFSIVAVVIGIGVILEKKEISSNSIIMGGESIKEIHKTTDKQVDDFNQEEDLERFFRPSKDKIINNIIENSLYPIYGENYKKIKLPKELLKTPEETIINYFSILREAANPTDDTKTGCGSLGDTKGPYPVAYNFLTSQYRKKLTYKEYLKSFENKLHINLVKLNKVAPDENNPSDIKYFVELEVIEGSNESKGLFAYYYGYVHLEKEDDEYKINNITYTPENYLCAPYHGWSYDAKSFVEIEYKQWCSLVDGETTVEENGYEKKVYFKDKDENEYYVLFYKLTNGTDIKIADYKKDKDGKWQLIYINPEKCLDKNKN